jgi:SAM-dependent methyltransferase
MSTLPSEYAGNLDRFSGLADLYDSVRPRPPAVLFDLLTQLAQAPRPGLVVDIGSGTGLSTMPWAERAEMVVGVEPNADMRGQAELRAQSGGGVTNVEFRQGLSSATGLPDGAADIVTISQALHWMEPEGTFTEVARILRPGGVFAAYDNDWPPAVQWEASAAYVAAMERANVLEEERGVRAGVKAWAKREHLARMRASGRFRWTEEVVMHHVEQGNANRFVGILLSQGGVAGLLRVGVSEAEIGIDELRRVAERTIGADPVPWYWSYRVRLGVR